MTAERALLDHYTRGGEQTRLEDGLGLVEFERTQEILLRHLPEAPADIADIGGGPGRYAHWLAGRGYSVRLRDIVPLHIDQAISSAAVAGLIVDAAVGDACDLDLADSSVDAVLLLGPLYHLTDPADRARCLAEAHRVLRPSGVVFAAAISRWAARLQAEVVRTLYRSFDNLRAVVPGVEASGVMPPLFEGSFSAYCHRPDELRREVEMAGFECLDLVSVEGITFALADLDERLRVPEDREVVFEAARSLERVPELLGIGPHLLATARRA